MGNESYKIGTNRLWERTICGNEPFVGTNRLWVRTICPLSAASTLNFMVRFFYLFILYLYFLMVLFNGDNCIQKVPLCLWYAPEILLKVLNFVDKSVKWHRGEIFREETINIKA